MPHIGNAWNHWCLFGSGSICQAPTTVGVRSESLLWEQGVPGSNPGAPIGCNTTTYWERSC